MLAVFISIASCIPVQTHNSNASGATNVVGTIEAIAAAIGAVVKVIGGILSLFAHNKELAELRKMNEKLVAKQEASKNILKYEFPPEFKNTKQLEILQTIRQTCRQG